MQFYTILNRWHGNLSESKIIAQFSLRIPSILFKFTCNFNEVHKIVFRWNAKMPFSKSRMKSIQFHFLVFNERIRIRDAMTAAGKRNEFEQRRIETLIIFTKERHLIFVKCFFICVFSCENKPASEISALAWSITSFKPRIRENHIVLHIQIM